VTNRACLFTRCQHTNRLLDHLIHRLVLRAQLLAVAVPLALMLALLLVTSASKLNQSWLVPGGKIKIDTAALKGEAGRVCALTFDDGPDSDYTAKICAILNKYEVKATFFCVGRNVDAYPKTMKQLVASGHEIGNHTYSHPVSTQLSITKLKQQLEKTNSVLEKYGVTPRWFRPPYGEISAADVKAASSLGFKTVLWSVDPRDWAEPGVDAIVSRVLGGASPGAVILLHCTHAQTVAALPRIIEGLRNKGYTFVTMTQWEQVVTGQGLPLAKPKQLPQTQPALPPEIQPAPKTLDAGLGLPGAAMEPAEGGMTPGFYEVFGQNEPQAEAAPSADTAVPPPSATAPVQPPTAPRGETLNVFANFLSAGNVIDVFRRGKADRLQMFDDSSLALKSQAPSAETAVTDEPVATAAQLPALPVGEGIVPPAGALQIPALPAQPAGDEAAAQSPQPPVQAQQSAPLSSVDLTDVNSDAAAWAPPATIDSANFLNPVGAASADGLYPPANFYFLCLVNDLGQYSWPELNDYVRLARLSGLLLPKDYGAVPPAGGMACPYAKVSLSGIDRSAWVDLTVQDVADVMEALKRQKQNVFLVMRPSNLRFYIAAQTLAELNDSLRDFVLFRQLTAGLNYDPAPAQAGSWQLPAGVQLGRFADGRHDVLILYSQNETTREVAVPPDYANYSRASIDAGGLLQIAPLDTTTLVVGKSPVMLYRESPPASS
jgi:peptidoglycan-N-acetylglucosamine deacetylase